MVEFSSDGARRSQRILVGLIGVMGIATAVLCVVVYVLKGRLNSADERARAEGNRLAQAQREAADQRSRAEELIARTQAERSAESASKAARRDMDLRIAGQLISSAATIAQSGLAGDARAMLLAGREDMRRLYVAVDGIRWALSGTYAQSPPPLMGPDGSREAAGGFAGHASSVFCVAFSPDGRQALTAGQGRTMILWDVATGMLVDELGGHSDSVFAVSFSPDGRFAVSGSADKTVRIWDLSTGKPIRSLTGHRDAVNAVAFSPGGRMVASGASNGTVLLWDVGAGVEIRRFEGADSVRTLEFSPDGWYLTSAGQGGEVRVHDLDSSALRHKFAGPGPANSIAYNADGTELAVGTDDQAIRVWDVRLGELKRTLVGHKAAVAKVAYAQDGALLSASIDGTVLRWDVKTGKELGRVSRPKQLDWPIAFSPDGRMALSSSGHRPQLWDVRSTPAKGQFVGHTSPTTAVVVPRDGRTALTAAKDRTIRQWDIATGQMLRTLAEKGPDEFTALEIAPDGTFAIAGDDRRTFTVWDPATGKAIRSFPSADCIPTSLAISRSGQFVAMSGLDSRVYVFNVQTGEEPRREIVHLGRPNSIAISPDDTRALSADSVGHICLWEALAKGRFKTLTNVGDPVLRVAFSLDGHKAYAIRNRGKIQAWDVASGDEVLTLEPWAKGLTRAVFSPDVRWALAAEANGTIWRVDLEKGATPVLVGNVQNAQALAFAPDGNSALVADGNSLTVLEQGSADHWLELEKSVCAARAAMEKDPEDAASALALAQWWAMQGFDDLAIEFYRKARARGLDASPLAVARCYWRMGRLDDARREFIVARQRKEAPEDYLNLCIETVSRSPTTRPTTMPTR